MCRTRDINLLFFKKQKKSALVPNNQQNRTDSTTCIICLPLKVCLSYERRLHLLEGGHFPLFIESAERLLVLTARFKAHTFCITLIPHIIRNKLVSDFSNLLKLAFVV